MERDFLAWPVSVSRLVFFSESTPLDLFTGFGETEEMVDWSVDVNCSLGHGWGFDEVVELELKLWAWVGAWVI